MLLAFDTRLRLTSESLKQLIFEYRIGLSFSSLLALLLLLLLIISALGLIWTLAESGELDLVLIRLK